MVKLNSKTDRVGGVYYIKNISNGKGTIYIGSSSRNIYQRVIKHISLLRHGKHHNNHLQASWNKYGKDGFEFGALERNVSPSMAHIREQYWFNYMLSQSIPTYNVGPIVEHPNLGRKMSDESREKIRVARAKQDTSYYHLFRIPQWQREQISKTLRDGYRTGRIRIISKPYPDLVNIFSGYIKNGGISRKSFCKELGLQESQFSDMINGKTKHYRGWMPIDRFLELDDTTLYNIRWKIRPPISEENRRRLNASLIGNKYRLGSHATEETRKKMSLSNIGKHHFSHTDEAKRKMSMARLGKPWTARQREAYEKRIRDNKT